MITDPPLFDGGVKETVALPFPGVAVTSVGAFGTVKGVTAKDGLDGILLPALFVAYTVKVYGMLLLKPVTVIEEPLPDTLTSPGLDTTV